MVALDTKWAIKAGVIAGFVSAALPSIPTIVHFEYWRLWWFRWYVLAVIGGLALLLMI